jgi:hypothetical protein
VIKISFDNKCNLKNNSNIYLYILENFFNTKVFFAIFKSMVFFENVLYKLFILTNLFLHDRINPRILIKKVITLYLRWLKEIINLKLHCIVILLA